eukprot:TRINITY_DN38610_c0_g1_i2.p1 TRINITY_DN38610_c0_g1~~TRINITY_DN38610_c0_g1_i2.p1  ORF type:complete len:248 (-),score=94.15 TRINITY_DN38610_c0_g1_i2:120-863(-)
MLALCTRDWRSEAAWGCGSGDSGNVNMADLLAFDWQNDKENSFPTSPSAVDRRGLQLHDRQRSFRCEEDCPSEEAFEAAFVVPKQRRRKDEGEERRRLVELAEASAEEASKRLNQKAKEARLLAAEQQAAEEEEMRLRQQEEAAEERRRQEEFEKLTQEQQEQNKVYDFLEAMKCCAVNERKRSLFRYTYPLHMAVSKNDSELVQLLVKCGAQKGARDSSGRTALDLAKKLDRRGSHRKTLEILHRS